MSFYRERIFPRLLSFLTRHVDDDRRALLSRASGRVLELGVGTGASLRFYGDAVDEVIGIDPNPGALTRARRGIARAEGENQGRSPRPDGRPAVVLQQADAQRLPFDDASFDTVVAFLTLCSIPDPLAAAREARRVLRAGGQLLLMEHVRAPAGSRLARWQDRLDRFWTRAAGGCHINRDTAAVLARAGFDTSSVESYRERGIAGLTAPRIRGVLR